MKMPNNFIRLHLVVILLLCSFCLQAKEPLKILAIGNSFSVDAVEQYLYELGAATKDSMIIGNAYISGCSLETYWNNADKNEKKYIFRKISGGIKTSYPDYTLLECILSEAQVAKLAAHYAIIHPDEITWVNNDSIE
jgi:hypothetical protein